MRERGGGRGQGGEEKGGGGRDRRMLPCKVTYPCSRRKDNRHGIYMLPWLPLHQITRTNVVMLIAIVMTTPPTTPPIAAPIAEGTAV